MTTNIAYLDQSAASGWQRTLYAFLAEKERRVGFFANGAELFAHAAALLRTPG